MSIAAVNPVPQSTRSREPAWDIARLFPAQGEWSAADYLALNGNYLVKFSNGYVEVLATPGPAHQRIVKLLAKRLDDFAVAGALGEVLFAPLRVRLWPDKFREPDVVFMSAAHAERRGDAYWDGADLVMEVVSDDDRRRDLETRRFEYARAGILEYWIVDPLKREITVLQLVGDHYEEHGIFRDGNPATSVLLPGSEVAVTETFDTK